MVLLAVLVSVAPASASFHFMRVVEVFSGTSASPNAHYVVLQMWTGGQHFVAFQSVQVYNAAGGVVGTFTFPDDVDNGLSQDKILIATPEASSLFGVPADLAMNPVISAAGGKICWAGTTDCVAWGNYSGSSTGVGSPVNPAGGIPTGQAIVRRLDIAGSPTVFDAGDDAVNSSDDFYVGNPSPMNNVTAVDGPGAGALAGRLFASPNPFRNEVTVLLSLPQAGEAEVGVYDLTGRRVRSLHRSALDAGAQRFIWDGRDDAGIVARAGLYVVRVRSAGLNSSTMVVRLR